MAEWKKERSTAAVEQGPSKPAGSAANATRRDVLKAAAAAAGSQLVAGPFAAARAQTAARPAHAFFTPEEFSLLDELTEMILPTDEHSPGARAAHCASFIDQQIHEAVEDELRSKWRDGLARVEALSQEMHGVSFLEASGEQRLALLNRIAQNEGAPQSAEERFFGELKSRTVFAYYTSKIGIHDELEYKGNVYQEEFAGYDAEPLDRGER